MQLRHRTWVVAALALGASLSVPALASAADSGPTANPAGGRFTVHSTADGPDAAVGDGRCADVTGACTLRAAIQEANAAPGATTIDLRAGSYRLTLANPQGDEEQSATGDLDVSSDVRMLGYGATVDAAGLDRAFEVMAGGSLRLTGLTITGGLVGGGADPVVGSGGGVANAGTLIMDQVTVTGNAATGPGASGGGVLSTGRLEIERSTVADNSATRAGGGIEANGGTTIVRLSTLRANTTGPTPGNGGGLHLTGAGSVEVHGSLVEANTAAAEGGGLWNSATGTMTVTATVVTANTASGAAADNGGGGLFNDGGTLSVEGSVVSANVADGAAGSGGGILNDGGTLSVARSGLLANSASRAGGGIEGDVGEMTLRHVTIDGNRTGAAPGNGGGVHITGAGNATIDHAVVTGNEAASEGGGLWNGSGTMTVHGSTISANRASGAAADMGGGGVFNNGGTVAISATTIADNIADGAAGSGGGLLNDRGTVTIEGSRVSGNVAVRAGGGIEANVGTTEVRTTAVTGNRTGPNPGNGGGLHLTGAGTVTVANSAFTGNEAAAEGGGVWNSATGTMTIARSAISANRAPEGPDVFNDGGTLQVDGRPVAAPTAP